MARLVGASPVGLLCRRAFVLEESEGEVDAFELTEPSLCLGELA